MPLITDAFQKLYQYLISISGVVALVVLIVGGIIYLTSVGEPEKLNKAKKQILAALFGIVLLLSSYLILRTINPELVNIQLSPLTPVVIHPLALPPGKIRSPILFDKVKNIVDEVKKAAENIENSSKEIKDLTDKCDCKNTQSLCLCSGGSSNDACQPQKCYAGPGTNPCPDFQEIKNQQQIIIAWRDEILYYKNRSLAEIEDLKDEVEKVLKEKIRYYTEVKATEKDPEVIKYFEDEIAKLEKEKQQKENLAAKLKELANWIEKIEPPMPEITQLANKCFYDEKGIFGIANKCQASCKEGKEYGCHDAKEGCQPDKCSGGNPCPVGEINDQLLTIQNTRPLIDQTGQEILNIIEEIIKLKTITI